MEPLDAAPMVGTVPGATTATHGNGAVLTPITGEMTGRPCSRPSRRSETHHQPLRATKSPLALSSVRYTGHLWPKLWKAWIDLAEGEGNEMAPGGTTVAAPGGTSRVVVTGGGNRVSGD